jgi:voltage-gated potassium channel
MSPRCIATCLKRLKPFRKQPEGKMKMAFIPQASAAVLLLVLTLCLQCAGVAALLEWLRRATAKGVHGFAPVRVAILVVQSTIAIIILHGLVILLWASFYRLQCFPSWELAFYFSSSSYATVGYGDVILPGRWRLLGPLESMAGVLMCGVSVFLLFATITRLIDRDPRHSRQLGCANDPVATQGESLYQ